MLYPAELGARRNAIQVRGAQAVKRNHGRPLSARAFPLGLPFGQTFNEAANSERERGSAREVEAADPGGLAALNRAARYLAQELAIGRV